MSFSNKNILVLIIITSVFLRFYNYFEIPFTHDEFSAFFRLNFDSFSELIQKGVKIDAHPAGIHVLIYYWSKIFGTSEWIIKLPFTIFGVISVYLIYKIAVDWFNETVGLICAAYLGTIQFTVMYSQIARPYISGMFFSLIMIYYWTQIIKKPDKKFLKNMSLFIVGASLCAYNHHFSLLFAAIVGFSGIFFINRKFIMWYFLSGLIIFILYLPHLEIFFYQLNIGGVGGPEGWLSKPENNYILRFLKYIFNFSFYSISTAIIIICFGLKKFHFDFSKIKTYLLFITWFTLPFLVGFFYSLNVNPVLQYSVLIFSFPVLFFVLFGHYKLQRPLTNLVLVLVIIFINITTLITERNHYNLFYKSSYKEILLDYKKVKEQYPNTIFIIDSHKEISKYYFEKLDIDDLFLNFDSFKTKNELCQYLKRNDSFDNLFFGCLSSNEPNSVPIIQDIFPNIKWQKNYAGGTTFLFNKEQQEKKIITKLSTKNDVLNLWSNIEKLTKSNNKGFEINPSIEWGPTYKNKLNNIITNKNNFIHFSVKARPNKVNLDDIILVTSIDSEDENIHWSGTNFKNFNLNYINGSEDWFKIHHTIKVSDINLDNENLILKTYIWNKRKNNFLIEDFEIELIDGNPIIYGLNEEI